MNITEEQRLALNKLNLHFGVAPEDLDEAPSTLETLVGFDLAELDSFGDFRLTQEGYDLVWEMAKPSDLCTCPDCR